MKEFGYTDEEEEKYRETQDSGLTDGTVVKNSEDEIHYALANDEGNNVAYFSTIDIGEKVIQLSFLYVDARYKNKGYGTEIIDKLKETNDVIKVFVDETAVDFYVKNGFKRKTFDKYIGKRGN